MKVDPSRSAAARKAKSPWRYNPMCITARAIAVFAEYERKPNQKRKAAKAGKS